LTRIQCMVTYPWARARVCEVTHSLFGVCRIRWCWSWRFPSTAANRPCTTWSRAAGFRWLCIRDYRSNCKAASGWLVRIQWSAVRTRRTRRPPPSTWLATRPSPPRWWPNTWRPAGRVVLSWRSTTNAWQ